MSTVLIAMTPVLCVGAAILGIICAEFTFQVFVRVVEFIASRARRPK